MNYLPILLLRFFCSNQMMSLTKCSDVAQLTMTVPNFPWFRQTASGTAAVAASCHRNFQEIVEGNMEMPFWNRRICPKQRSRTAARDMSAGFSTRTWRHTLGALSMHPSRAGTGQEACSKQKLSDLKCPFVMETTFIELQVTLTWHTHP